MRSTTLSRSCAFSASSRSSSTGMKVCTFEPPLGCRACSRAKLGTSSLLFDRAILFMSPLTVANYRLDGTVMRYAGENLNIACDLPLACRKHRSHIPFLPATQRMVNPAARQWLQIVGTFLAIANHFFSNPQSICFAFRSYLFRLFRVSEPARETTRSLVIMRNKICSIGSSKGGCYA